MTAAYDELNRIDDERQLQQQLEQEQEQQEREQEQQQETETERTIVEGTQLGVECNGHDRLEVETIRPPSCNLGGDSIGGDMQHQQQHPSDDMLEFETETESEIESSDISPSVPLTPEGQGQRQEVPDCTPVKQKHSPSPISVLDPQPEVSGLTRISSAGSSSNSIGIISGSNSACSSRVGSPRGLTAMHSSTSSTSTSINASAGYSPTPRRLSLGGGAGGEQDSRDRAESTPPSPSPSTLTGTGTPSAQQTEGSGSPRVIVRELRKELAKAHAEVGKEKQLVYVR